MSTVKIVICTDGIYPFALGGMQKHSHHLISSLAGFPELEIFVIHPHQDLKNINGARSIYVAGIDEKRNYLIECYKYSKRVFGKISEIKPDVVYAQGLTVWYGIDKIQCPVVVNPHGLEAFQVMGFKQRLVAIPFRAVFRYIFKRADVLISLGGKLTTILQHAGSRTRVETIANGVAEPTRKAALKETGTTNVLFFARFAQNKGIDVLFEAIEILENQGRIDKFKFILAGGGPLFSKYKKLESTYVSLPGYIKDDDVADLYTNCDVFVLPTLYEGMPTVVLEAMSYGIPVIVSDVGATSELVDELNGRLVKAGSPADLADALAWFGSLDRTARQSLSKAAIDKVYSNFTWNRIAEKHRSLFLSLAEQSSKRLKLTA